MTSEAVVDICAYHRRDFDVVMVRSRPHDTQKVIKDFHTAFQTTPTAGLGILDQLPLELLSIVCRNLDLLSYFRFRQVNRQARVVSTSVLEYQSVVKHGLEGLRGMLRAGLAQSFTIRDLRPKSLVAAKLAIAKLEALGIIDQAIANELSGLSNQENQRFMASTAFTWYDPKSNKIESGDPNNTSFQHLDTLGVQHNFIIGSSNEVVLIDFEKAVVNADAKSLEKEMASLKAELSDESGRGGGFMEVEE
ncbi:F-box domain, Skp2-like protein [Fusarium austroafricanum]|uniref:F-box domain, Skp2-like protein n=1 Tax=Fusarium austroafricanum TaxID=2364996 RepID=A0A8H4JNU9_9HYPO|nr:F-box domain, Skp2-like protein [Fusarium austroafricanum]